MVSVMSDDSQLYDERELCSADSDETGQQSQRDMGCVLRKWTSLITASDDELADAYMALYCHDQCHVELLSLFCSAKSDNSVTFVCAKTLRTVRAVEHTDDRLYAIVSPTSTSAHIADTSSV